MNRFNRRLETASEKISELEDIVEEIMQMRYQETKRGQEHRIQSGKVKHMSNQSPRRREHREWGK